MCSPTPPRIGRKFNQTFFKHLARQEARLLRAVSSGSRSIGDAAGAIFGSRFAPVSKSSGTSTTVSGHPSAASTNMARRYRRAPRGERLRASIPHAMPSLNVTATRGIRIALACRSWLISQNIFYQCGRLRTMKRVAMREYGAICFFAFALLALSAEIASALDGADNCDEPRLSPEGRKFFIDPARGAMDNDGSESKPWRTLAEVLDSASHQISTRTYVGAPSASPMPINQNGPVKPGDTLILMSGNHGAVHVPGYVNDDYISIVAAPGQTPVVSYMVITGSSHWRFQGIKFQGERQKGQFALIDVRAADTFWGANDNIIFEGNSVSTTDDTSSWSEEDWVKRPNATALKSASRCTVIRDNHIYNIRDALSISGNHSIVENNLIERMGNDGIDIMASDLIIRHNRIRSSRHTSAEPLHADGIQGWTLGGATNRNVTIDGNAIINEKSLRR